MAAPLESPTAPECPFCAVAAGRAPAHVVLERPSVVAFLDRRPLFPGHVLVVPSEHVADLPTLPRDLAGDLWSAVQLVAAAMPAALGADGSFVACNNVVSQSVPHLHVHVVPRRRGDGLRGFFWPRQRYADEEAAADVAARLRAELDCEGA